MWLCSWITVIIIVVSAGENLAQLTTEIFTSAALPLPTTQTNHGAGYLGCFKENRRQRVFNDNPGFLRSDRLTIARCYTACDGLNFQYAALSSGKFCFCSNTDPKTTLHIEADDTKCLNVCPGNINEACGSLTHIRVFLSTKKEKVYISMTAFPKVATIGQKVVISGRILPGCYLSLDYGDGSGRTKETFRGNGLLTREYHQAGTYVIKVYARLNDTSNSEAMVSVGVHVNSPVEGVSISCPSVMVAYDVNACKVEIRRGTNMEITIQYTYGGTGSTMSSTFPISDAREYWFGSPVQEKYDNTTSSTVTPNADQYLLLMPVTASHSGTLLGFEFAAKAIGSFNIAIYRPSPIAGQEFCKRTNTFVTTGRCWPSCSAGYPYCSSKKECCSNDVTNVYMYPLNGTYKIKHLERIDSTKVGYQFQNGVSTGVLKPLLPGDLIAIGLDEAQTTLKDGVLGTRRNSVKCPMGMGSMSLDASVCKGFQSGYHLKAVYAEKSTLYVPLQWSEPGNVAIIVSNTSFFTGIKKWNTGANTSSFGIVLEKCFGSNARRVKILYVSCFCISNRPSESVVSCKAFKATVKNRGATVTGNQTVEADILVLDGVNASVLDIPDCVKLNTSTVFALEPFSGSNVSVQWSFGDSNGTVVDSANMSTGEVEHTYTVLGTYNISVNVSNLINSKYNTSTICVQEPIGDLDIQLPTVVQTGMEVIFNVSVAHGSDYKCELSLTTPDGQQNLSTIHQRSSFKFTSNTKGDVEINVTCSNRIGRKVKHKTLYVIEPGIVKEKMNQIFQIDNVSLPYFRQQLAGLHTDTLQQFDAIDVMYYFDDVFEYVTLVSDMCNKMSRDDELNEYRCLGTVASFKSTRLYNNTTRPCPFTKDSFNDDKSEAYNTMRSNTAYLIEKLVYGLERCHIDSTTQMVQLVQILSKLSIPNEFLDQITQNKMMTLLKTAVKNLTNNVIYTEDEMEIILGQSFETYTNIELASILTEDFPTQSDLRSQATNVLHFDTNMDSDVPDVAMFDDDGDAVIAGEKILNKIVQIDFADTVHEAYEKIKEDLIMMMHIHSLLPMELLAQSGSATLEVTNVSVPLTETMVKVIEAGAIAIPADAFETNNNETLVMAITGKAATRKTDNGLVDRFSREIAITIQHTNGTRKAVQHLRTPIVIHIKRDPYQIRANYSALKYIGPLIPENREDEYLFYHRVKVTVSSAALKLIFRPTNITSDKQLLVLVNYEERPSLDVDHTAVKHVCMIPSNTGLADTYGNDSVPDAYACFIDVETIKVKTGNWIIGVRQLLRSELNQYQNISSLPSTVPDRWKSEKEFTQDYTLMSVQVTCAYSEDGCAAWKTDGVKPTELSTADVITCESTHLSAFAGGWAVVPNTIDWNFVFSNADFMKNPTLYVTQVVIVVAYVITMVWARRRDRYALERQGMAPLRDNNPNDKYCYEIIVTTGIRRNAGTESKVHFVLTGEDGETDVRTFVDTKRKIFRGGNTDGFVMTVSRDLGALMYIRIWHDNEGKGSSASWYLNHIAIRDVQTDKKYHFICYRWLAVEEDDGQVDRLLPVAGKQQMTEFGHLFRERATKNLRDGHLWFSVFAMPPHSRFTCCQRVSCCLCLLFTTMLTNAMFYGTERPDADTYTFGPFAVTPQQIFIGIASNLIIFPINFLLITIFRKSRPRKRGLLCAEDTLRSTQSTATIADVVPRFNSSLAVKRQGSSFLSDSKVSDVQCSGKVSSLYKGTETKNLMMKRKFELPWWFVIIGWVLLWTAVLVSMAFVTSYGIMFRDIKCKMWITSMLVSFVTSVFLTQPLKVLLFAIILSLIIKNPGDDDEDGSSGKTLNNLPADEELLHTYSNGQYHLRPLYKPLPPDSKTLKAAREKRLKEIEMWSVIREISFYICFIIVLLVISNGIVSSNSYNYKQSMERVFIKTNDNKHHFTKVKNVQDFWTWARNGMLAELRAGPYYNNYPPFYLRGYINDKQSRLMGYAILRQVRVKPGTCKLPAMFTHVVKECNAPYDMGVEEKRDFSPGWTMENRNYSSRNEYEYTDACDINSYPYYGEMAIYGGGGYIVKLNNSHSQMLKQFLQLEHEKWIDKYTRAVFLEFTVYNPSINMFAISTLLSEFRPSGGVFASYRFEPCTLLPYVTSGFVLQVTCQIVYCIFTLVFVIKEIRCLIKQKMSYFHKFWNVMELCIGIMSLTAVIVFFYRRHLINELTDYFNKTHGNSFMKFQYVGYWSEILNYVIGFLVFLAILKFLKLLRFNKRVSLFADTLKHSGRSLIHFGIIFNIIFLAFIQLFYLMYVAHLDIFKTFVKSWEAGLVMVMGKFDIYDMLGVNEWLTQIFLFLFVVTVTFIMVNMFLSILSDTFSAVRNDKTKQENDYEIVDFMMRRFQLWTGMGGFTDKKDESNGPDAQTNMLSKNTLEEKIDSFPNQIDRFLVTISKVYMGRYSLEESIQGDMYRNMLEKAKLPMKNVTHVDSNVYDLTDVHMIPVEQCNM